MYVYMHNDNISTYDDHDSNNNDNHDNDDTNAQ